MKSKITSLMLLIIFMLSCSNNPAKKEPGNSNNNTLNNTAPTDNRTDFAATSTEDSIKYEEMVSMKNEYRKHPNKLKYLSGQNKDSIVQGFRIKKSTLDRLFLANPNSKELFICFGIVENAIGVFGKYEQKSTDEDFTLIFAAATDNIIKDTNKTTGIITNYYGTIETNKVFEYVRPCPPYCPKFPK